MELSSGFVTVEIKSHVYQLNFMMSPNGVARNFDLFYTLVSWTTLALSALIPV